jgi:hypothetical protein
VRLQGYATSSARSSGKGELVQCRLEVLDDLGDDDVRGLIDGNGEDLAAAGHPIHVGVGQDIDICSGC